MSASASTVSINGVLTHDTTRGQSETALSLALRDVTRVEPTQVTLTPGQLAVDVDPPAAASLMLVQSNRVIRMRLNGGTTDIVGRFLLLGVSAVTTIELNNDQLASPKTAEVDILFVVGGEAT